MVSKDSLKKLIPLALCSLLAVEPITLIPTFAQTTGGNAPALPIAHHCHMHTDGSMPHFNHTQGFFIHHHAMGNVGNTPSQLVNSSNTQSHIGAYHAGYVWHGPQQQVNVASSFHHHFNHNGVNQLANQLSGNGQTTNLTHIYHHFNNQPVTLNVNKSDNGSLLGSVNLNNNFLNLNLSSSQAIIRADNRTAVMITVGGLLSPGGHIIGGTQQVIMPGQMVTAAQYTAMEQVVTSGQQTLVLSGHGTAISGVIALVAGQSIASLSSVVVPRHVVLETVGFTSSNPFSVSGTTQVLGSLYTLESSANVTAALNSGSLFVGGRGTISDSLRLSFFNNVFAASGLNLGVLGTLTNQGSISSVGALTVNAGQIVNVSAPTRQAVMSGQSVNLYSASGIVRNSGLIVANAGNVNFAAPASKNIAINNSNGTVQALQGAINVRDAAYAGNANQDLSGGNWLSKEVNLNSGTGIVTANVENVTGAINTNAGEAHILTKTDDLIIGNTNLSGDPSFFNSNNVTIAGNLNFSGQDLAVVAGKNIRTAVGAGSINTSSATGNGGNITMVAGANFTSSGSSSGSNDTTTTLTLSGGSATGGYIDLQGNISGSGVAINTLNSSSTAFSGNGGNITMVAYGGSKASSGVVNLPSSLTVVSGGSGAGSNGSVSILAGASSGNSINIGMVNTTGSNNGSGSIMLSATTPVIFSGAGTMTIKNGSITNGASFGSMNLNSASVVAGALTSSGGAIVVEAGKGIRTGTITSNGAGANGNGGNIYLTVAHNANAHLQVTGNLQANGTGTGDGGNIYMSYNGSQSPAGTLFIGSSSASANYVSGNISADGGLTGGNGGSINITSISPNPLNPITGVALKPLNIALNGTISANGTALGNVNFSGKNISVVGPGAINAMVNNNNNAAAVTYRVGTGNLTLGHISNANGNIRLTNNATNGIILATQNIISAHKLLINGGKNGNVMIASGVVLSGTAAAGANAVNVRTPNLSLNGSIVATSGNVVVRNTVAGSPLTVNMGAGSSINAATGNITLNNGANGALVMNSGFGDISAHAGAGRISLNASSTTIGINLLSGNITGTPGATNITVASGNVSIVGPIDTNGQASTLTNNASGGSVAFNSGTSNFGNLTVNTTNTGSVSIANGANVNAAQATLTTPTFNNNGNLTASQALTIQSNAANNVLAVNLGAGSNLSGNSVTFNRTGASAGAITVSGASGTINVTGANQAATFNAGPTGAVSVNVATINGLTAGQGNTVNVTVANGQLILGNWNSFSTGNTSMVFTNSTENVDILSSLTSAGQLTVTSGSSGGISTTTGNLIFGTSVTFNAGTHGINIFGNTAVRADSVSGNAGNITLTATNGAIVLGTGTVSAQALGATGNGGKITISGLSFTANNQINANATGNGNGGTISIINTGATGDLTIDGSVALFAQSGLAAGNGGTITLTAGRSLTITSNATINVAARSPKGTGGVINLTNGTAINTGNMQINQSLVVSSSGGKGGQIKIANNSTNVFVIQNAAVTNGINGSLLANGVSGGTISVSNSGSGGITVVDFANISVAASAGAGGSLTLNANNGILTIPSGTINVSATGGNNGGGTISLTGSSIVQSGGAGKTLSLIADASGTGNGGSITLKTTGAAGDINLGNSAGSIAGIHARGGSVGSASGNGGAVNISAARNLTISNPSGIIDVSPRGTNGNGGKITLTNGAVTAGNLKVDVDLIANGVGTGSGGSIVINNRSASAFVIQNPAVTNGISGTLQANAGSGVGGTGGTISINNTGTGGITLVSFANILLNSGGGGGAGGSLTLNANSGLLTIPNGKIDVSAKGPGSYNGGTISLTGSSIVLNGGNGTTLSLLANAFGTGNGGSVSVRTTSVTGDISLGNAPNNFANISARGGSAGSFAGNGGTVTLIAGRNLAISGAAGIINVSPSGTNGNGGSITLTSGNVAATGTVQVDQSVNADGAGTGKGGTISVSYKNTGALTIGAVSGNSYIAGNVSASTSGTTGGTVNIANTANAPLLVSLVGNISATASTNSGNINFTSKSGQSINVAGNGSLNGIVNNNASAASVNYQTTGNLVLGTVNNASGDITATTSTGSVFNTVNIQSAAGLILTSAPTGGVTIANGTSVLGAFVTINTPNLTLKGNAAVNATAGDLSIYSNAISRALTINAGIGSSLTGANVTFNSLVNPGAITMNSGYGEIDATDSNGKVSFNGGMGSGAAPVNINVSAINGTITGTGSNISIDAASNLQIAGLTSYANGVDAGDITINTSGSGHHIIVSYANGGQSISSAGGLTMTSSSNGWVALYGALNVVAKSDITINTPVLGIDFSSNLKSLNGNVNIQSNASNHALSFYMHSGAAITSLTGNVNFNLYNSGAITNSAGLGSIVAANGTVNFNGGVGSNAQLVNVSVDSISGEITGQGKNIVLTVASGNLKLGTLTSYINASTGDIVITDNSANGIITVSNTITSAGGVSITESGNSGSLFINNGSNVTTLSGGTDVSLTARTLSNYGTVTANRDLIIAADALSNVGTMTTTRDLDVSSFTVGAPLTITASNGLALNAGRDINFGYNNASQITVTGLPINAGRYVSFNGGNNSVFASSNSIAGTVIGGGSGNLIGSSFCLLNLSGNINLGAMTSTGGIKVVNGDSASPLVTIYVLGTVSSTGSDVSMTAGMNGSIVVNATGSVSTNGGDVILLGNAINNAGSISANRDVYLGSNNTISTGPIHAGRDLNVYVYVSGHALSINSSNGSFLSAGRDVNLGIFNASQITITGLAINAGRNVSFNGGNNAVLANLTSINGTAIGGGVGNLIGSSFNLSNSSGNMVLGSLTSPGMITVLNSDNTSGTTHGGISVVGTVSSTGGAISLTAGTNGSLAISATGAVQITGAGNDISLTAKTLSNAGSIAANRDLILIADSLFNSGSMTTFRDLDIASRTNGASLVINGSNGLNLTAGRDINFGYNNASQITITGVPINAGRYVSFNGALLNAVLADVTSINGTVIGGGVANLIGGSFNLSNTSGNIVLGAMRSLGSITVLNGDSTSGIGHGGITVTDIVSSLGGSISLTSGANGTLAVNASGIVRTVLFGTDVTLAGKTVSNAGTVTANRDLIIAADNLSNSGVMTSRRDLDISSFTAGSPLTINASNGLALTAVRDINFGYNNASQITVTGLPINAGRYVSFNGGANAVLATVTSINGTVIGGGAANLIGSSFNLSNTSGNIVLGAMTSPGPISVVNGDNGSGSAHGNITIVDAISSTGSAVSITGGNRGSMVVNNGALIAGSTVTLVTPYLSNSGNISANAGDLNIQSNGSANRLTIRLGSGSTLTATGNVNFNYNNAGTIRIRPLGGTLPNGTMSANNGSGQVNLNIGSGRANVRASSIIGTVQDPNANFALPVAGRVSIITASGQLTVGNFASTKAIVIRNLGSTGTVVTNGDLQASTNLRIASGGNGSLTVGSGNNLTAGNSVTLRSPVQNINGFVLAQNGDVNLQSNGAGHALVVNMGPDVGGNSSSLVSNNGNVNFNLNHSGVITITGGANNGLISAANSNVVLNGGSGAINTANKQIIGCIHVNGSSINMQTWQGDLDFCLGINTSSTSGSGGSISIAANGGAVNSGAITTNGSGAGNSAGNINISSASGINVGDINANGNSGASGGVVTITTPGTITGTFISATGAGSGNGGIFTTSGRLVLNGKDGSGNSLTTNVTGSGTAGNMIIHTTSPQEFVVGSGAGTGNGTLGNISANGLNGGFIILKNEVPNSTPSQVIIGSITANGTTGTGGKVELEALQPLGAGPLTVLFNGGLIQATNNANNLGRVGFNGGPGQNISLLGFGTINGGEFVHAGNLDEFTLEFINPPAGTIIVSPGLVITNNFATNGIIPQPVAPISPITPQFLISQAQAPAPNPIADLSKTATDYTPWGHFRYQYYEKIEQPRFHLGIAYKRKTTAYIPGTKSYGHMFAGGEVNRLVSYGMQLNSTGVANYLDIDRGNILLSPDKDIVVGTHEANVYMAPGSIAFVMESGSDVVIYDLHQTAPNQVSVVVNKQKLFLHPGHMMVLTRQKVNDFEEIDADCHMVSYRSAQEVPLKDKSIKAFTAEYSIASAFFAVEPLKQLIASNDRQDQSVFDKIIKGAVMLNDFSGTIDMAQLANLSKDAEADRMADKEEEEVLDSAKKMATKAQPIQ